VNEGEVVSQEAFRKSLVREETDVEVIVSITQTLQILEVIVHMRSMKKAC